MQHASRDCAWCESYVPVELFCTVHDTDLGMQQSSGTSDGGRECLGVLFGTE